MSGLSLQEAADRLGVHYMTAYRYVRLGKLPATKSGSSWVVDEADLARLGEDGVAPRSHADWVGELLHLMLAGDATGAWVLIEQALASSFTPEEVLTELILPAMREVGIRWEHGEIGIAEEHLASAVARRLVARMSPRFTRRGRTRGSVVVAMGPGEWHQLGAEVLADLLRGRNLNVLYLGANTPPEAIALAVESAEDVVAVVVAAFEHQSALASIGSALDVDVPIVMGGPVAVDQATVEALGGDHFVASITDAVDVVDELV